MNERTTERTLNEQMDKINQFKIFQIFLSKYVDVTLEDLFKMERALYYYKRLNGKTLDDITSLMSKDYRQVTKIAGELEVFRYSNNPLPKQRVMIVEKFNSIFSACDLSEKHEYSNIDEKMIQAPLESGVPYEILENDEIDITDCLKNSDIEFIEDKNGDMIPIGSTMTDFLRPTLIEVYHKMYRSLKWYKGRYYQYKGTKWQPIDSLEEVTKHLFDIVRKNTKTLNEDFAKMYNFINDHNKVYVHIRNKLEKSLEKTVKLNSKVNLLDSCNEQEERVIEQEMSVDDSVEQKKMCIDRNDRDEKMMNYFGKVDTNMPRFFSK